MPPVTSGSLLYNSAGSLLHNSFTSLPDVNSMWTSPRSSWIYLDMDHGVKKVTCQDSSTESGSDGLSNFSTYATSFSFSTTTTTTLPRTGTLTSSISTSGASSSSSSSSIQSFLSSTQTRKSSCGSDCGATYCQTLLFAIVWDASTQLWKDNPERDVFSTFSVSEQDLTQAIAYLETELGPRAFAPAIVQRGNGDLAGERDLPFRVRFVLDSYCNIFMLR